MPKIRIRGYKINNGHKVYSKGIKLRKKNGHTHIEYETKNLKGQTVIRCSICKFHYIFLL